MFSVLIVDDNKIERAGIKFLIEDNRLPFTVAEANNGRSALAYLQSNAVHVLFTDIKMPFMDGLELAQKARELNPELKIVFFSAYGEFEYARKAIELKATFYILKPVVIDEFKMVLNEVLRLLQEDEAKRREQQKLLDIQTIAREYEKEKLLIRVLAGGSVEDETKCAFSAAGFDLSDKTLRMIFIETRSGFFEKNNEEFQQALKDIVGVGYDYLNLNERQSVLFLFLPRSSGESGAADDIAERIKTLVGERYATYVCIVISGAIQSLEELGVEFRRMEDTLDYGFFYDSSVILRCQDPSGKQYAASGQIDAVMDNIRNSLSLKKLSGVKNGIDLLLQIFKDNREFSQVYVKHLFAELLKLLHDTGNIGRKGDFSRQLDLVFKSRDFESLASFVLSDLDESLSAGSGADPHLNKKVIQDVYEIVAAKYKNDISLEWIAAQVYLSPGYLSWLFKKETGLSLVKYLTQFRMEKAKELLVNTNLKISDVAASVGYSDVSYFGTIFRNHCGTSPSKYRGKED